MHGLVTISPESLPPQNKLVGTTRSTVNPSVMSFHPRKCGTTTFQKLICCPCFAYVEHSARKVQT